MFRKPETTAAAWPLPIFHEQRATILRDQIPAPSCMGFETDAKLTPWSRESASEGVLGSRCPKCSPKQHARLCDKKAEQETKLVFFSLSFPVSRLQGDFRKREGGRETYLKGVAGCLCRGYTLERRFLCSLGSQALVFRTPSILNLRCAGCFARLFCALVLILGCFSRVASAQIDAGGGLAAIGSGFNHASVGSAFATVAEGVGVAAGFIEELYPFDGDADRVSDVWELRFFGVLNRPLTADDDGDGTSNLLEYLAGTDPTDGRSVLRASLGRSEGDLVLSFPTVSGRRYRVLESPDLFQWRTLETVTANGLGVERRYPISGLVGDRYFLKVEPEPIESQTGAGMLLSP